MVKGQREKLKTYWMQIGAGTGSIGVSATGGDGSKTMGGLGERLPEPLACSVWLGATHFHPNRSQGDCPLERERRRVLGLRTDGYGGECGASIPNRRAGICVGAES